MNANQEQSDPDHQEPASPSSTAIWLEMVITYGLAVAILVWNWC